MSEEEGLMLHRHSSPTSPAPTTPPLDDDNILIEILLRLSPQPSSLHRASLVCKRWCRCRLVSDPCFLGRFREHHRKPRLLGFFALADGPPSFTPTLPPPDCIPDLEARFSLAQSPDEQWDLVDCRDGLTLFIDRRRLEAFVWDPLTGYQRRVPFPPGFDNVVRNAAVLFAAAGEDVHRDSRLRPFKLVLVQNDNDRTRAFACIYESKSGLWGNVISATITDGISDMTPSVLVGNSLFWLLFEGDILEFDLEMQSLIVIKKPADSQVNSYSGFQILRTEESGLGFAVLTGFSTEIWQRKIDSDGIARWVIQKTVELDKVLLPGSPTDQIWVAILGYLEDNNVIFLLMDNRVFMVQLELMTFKNLFESDSITTYYPFTSFYAAGNSSSLLARGTYLINCLYVGFLVCSSCA